VAKDQEESSNNDKLQFEFFDTGKTDRDLNYIKYLYHFFNTPFVKFFYHQVSFKKNEQK
jgi:hypothetical protein